MFASVRPHGPSAWSKPCAPSTCPWPIWPSKVNNTASAKPKRSSVRWKPSCTSTRGCSASRCRTTSRPSKSKTWIDSELQESPRGVELHRLRRARGLDVRRARFLAQTLAEVAVRGHQRVFDARQSYFRRVRLSAHPNRGGDGRAVVRQHAGQSTAQQTTDSRRVAVHVGRLPID